MHAESVCRNTSGIPQGSNLGPLQFSFIYINMFG